MSNLRRVVAHLASFLQFFLLFGLLTGCQSGSEPGSEDLNGHSLTDRVIVIDGLGRELSFTSPPSRIVSIAPSATEILVAAGGLDRLVGVTNVDDYPPEIAGLPVFSALPLDIESVAAMDPDLVMASDQVNDPNHVELFTALGIPIFYQEAGSWAGIRSALLDVSMILGTEDVARKTVDSLDARISALKQMTSSAEPVTGIFLVSDVTSYSFGQGSYALDLMEWAGITPLTREFDTPAPVLSDEWVLMANPDVIIGTFGDGFTIEDLLEHHPAWSSLDAVRLGRVYAVDGDSILRPGPRNVLAVEQMARLVFPEYFTTERTDR
ncbi:MAG: helical backbone metal receptor [Bacteroidetes bacterium]|nr:helical backbone metal receptor [Bacteroidota bacterium]